MRLVHTLQQHRCIRINEDVLADGGWREGNGDRFSVAGPGRQDLVMGHLGQHQGVVNPGLFVQLGIQVYPVGPARRCGRTCALVLHRPGDCVFIPAQGLEGIHRHVRHNEIWDPGSAQNIDSAGLVVVIVDFVRVVGINVDSQRVFQHHIVRIAPGHDIVRAGGQSLRERDGQRLIVSGSYRQRT